MLCLKLSEVSVGYGIILSQITSIRVIPNLWFSIDLGFLFF